jgi:hypothetical protein
MSMFDFADNPGQARIMAERQIVPPPPPAPPIEEPDLRRQTRLHQQVSPLKK